RRRTRRDRDMTADALNLLADIRRVGGDVKLISCDKLKLVAPTPLLPELARRVRAAKPMLLAALADDTGPAQREGVSFPPNNRATVQRLPAESSDRAIPMPAADWYARYHEALAYWSAFHAPGEAARLAWGEMENQWHQLRGEHVAPHLCAGCEELIGGGAALGIRYGSCVHISDLDFVLRFGERRRAAAPAAPRALGAAPPRRGWRR